MSISQRPSIVAQSPELGKALITDIEGADLKSKMHPEIANPHNVKLLSKLSLEEREYFARASNTVVLYIGDEVRSVMQAEEDAAMRAIPAGYHPIDLIGLNIGCGNRLISPYLTPVDILCENVLGVSHGEHVNLTASALLSKPDDLPFRAWAVDYIVSLHMLEHSEDPIKTVNHWLDIIKPGGGIGVVVPDWRYNWDARNDHARYGHKWNPTPELIEKLYSEHWSYRAELEVFCSYNYACSFDFVLRKCGEFVPIIPISSDEVLSGAERSKRGIFLHGQ